MNELQIWNFFSELLFLILYSVNLFYFLLSFVEKNYFYNINYANILLFNYNFIRFTASVPQYINFSEYRKFIKLLFKNRFVWEF